MLSYLTSKIADSIAFIALQAGQVTPATLFWQRATAVERVRNFRNWILQLPKNSPGLLDEAFSRDTIYADDELST